SSLRASCAIKLRSALWSASRWATILAYTGGTGIWGGVSCVLQNALLVRPRTNSGTMRRRSVSVNLRGPVVGAGPSKRPQRLPLCLGGRGLQRDAELGRAQIWEQARHSDKQRLLRRAHADQAGDFSGHWGGVEHGQLLVLSGFLVPVGVFDVSCHSS